jgi:hypothetical protein
VWVRSDVCTLHHSEPNASGAPRWALVGNYCHPANSWSGLAADDTPQAIGEPWGLGRVRAAARRQWAQLRPAPSASARPAL